MVDYPIQKIVAVGEAKSSPLTQRAIMAWPDAQVVESPAAGSDDLELSPDPVAEGKNILTLYHNKGKFIRKCPGTQGLVCCNYWVIDLAEGCAIDCAYCVLQGYLTDRRIRLAVNLEDLEAELDQELEVANGPIRLGTGELSDSLMFDRQLDLSTLLIEMVAKRPAVTLELKTKTANIDNILKRDPKPNVVIGWSLNTAEIAGESEPGSAPVEERLKAASAAVEAGWKVAFHFDPLVIHDEWEEGYRQTVKMLAGAVPPKIVEWISLGALRFHPSMKAVIRERFGSGGILKGEFVLCPDNKMRYPKPVRLSLFNMMKQELQEALPGVPLYLCMEGAEVWRKVFGAAPAGGAMKRLFG